MILTPCPYDPMVGSRHSQLKKKFKAEDIKNPDRVTQALKNK